MDTGNNGPNGPTNEFIDDPADHVKAEIARVQSFRNYERKISNFPAAYRNAQDEKQQIQALLNLRDAVGARCKFEDDLTLIKQEAEEAIKMATDDPNKRATYMLMIENELKIAQILSGGRETS